MAKPQCTCLLLAALLTGTCSAESWFPLPPGVDSPAATPAPSPPALRKSDTSSAKKEAPTPAPKPAPKPVASAAEAPTPAPAPAPTPKPAPPAPTKAPVPLAKVSAGASEEGPQGKLKFVPPAPDHQPMKNALQALNDDMWALIKTKDYQWVIAIAAFVFGSVALHDGRNCLRLLVLIGIAALFFLITLSQLHSTWTGKIASKLQYVASIEVGLFVGLAAHKGWKGTQLLLGLMIGIYMFQMSQDLANHFNLEKYAEHSAAKTIVCTLLVLLGSWMVDEKRGAGKVLGLLAPLFGSSLVVAALGFASMFALSAPQVGKGFHVVVSPADVPSVFEYWYMICYPMHSQVVGFFRASQTKFALGNHNVDLDRVTGIVSMAVIALLGVRRQMRRVSKEWAWGSYSLKARLLATDGEKKPQKK